MTTLPPDGFLATDVLDLYQGRGAFEGTLADEDQEGDPDRWCSFTAPGQEFWQIVWQWVWNLRLAFSAGCTQAPLREMEWVPPPTGSTQPLAEPAPQEEPEYGPLDWARAWGGRLGAEAFPLQDDGMLRCPQGVRLWQSEIRQESAFTQRLIFAACLGRTASGTRGRRVSAVRHRRITGVVLHPRPSVAAAAIRWNDVAGRQLRRSWMTHWRQQTVTVASLPASLSPPARPPRAARSHQRLSWSERLGRNARRPLLVTSIQVSGVTQQVLDLIQPHA